MKVFVVMSLLLLAVVGWSRGTPVTVTTYGDCLMLCGDWYDGCKFGSQNATIMDAVCRNYYVACTNTCSRQYSRKAD